MNKSFKSLLYISSFLFFSSIAEANVASEMNKLIGKMGGNFSNYSQGGAYKDQLGGHYTGGSAYIRTPAHNVTPFNIQMPSIKAGCGGIDAYMGGFSFINSKNLVAMMRDIPSKAISYGITIALDQTSPMLSNGIKNLTSMAQRANDTNINSCQAGATLAGGLWPKTDASSKLLCSQMGTSLGIFSDFSQARQGCNESKFEEVMSRKGKSEFKDILGSEYNLAWKALMTNQFFKNDLFLARFLMTVSGTIVSRKVQGSDKKFEITHYHSKALDGNLLDTLMNGGTSKIYKCDEPEECLYVSEDSFTIENKEDSESKTVLKGLIVKINDTLDSISRKLVDEDAGETVSMTDSEKGLINSTSIPIMKIMDVQTAFRSNRAAISWSEYTDAIAYDMVLGYMEFCSETMLAHLHNVKNAQLDPETAREFRKELIKVKSQITTKRHSILERINMLLSIKQKTQLIEKQLMSYFESTSTDDEK